MSMSILAQRARWVTVLTAYLYPLDTRNKAPFVVLDYLHPIRRCPQETVNLSFEQQQDVLLGCRVRSRLVSTE